MIKIIILSTSSAIVEGSPSITQSFSRCDNFHLLCNIPPGLLYLPYITMYHLDVNSPSVESIRAILESGTLPSAALDMDNSLTRSAYSSSLEENLSRARKSSRSFCRPCLPSSQAEPPQEHEHDTVLIASWGQYQTLTQMRTSPFYLGIELQMYSDDTLTSHLPLGSSPCHNYSTAASESLGVQAEQTQSGQHLTLHAVHPIPMRHLRKLTQHQLEFLYGYLAGRRFQPGGELSRRFYETMDNIGGVVYPEAE